MTEVLSLKKVTKSYPTPQGKLTVLSGVDLSIQAGEKVAIIGQSGTGKSTLLHVAGLLDEADKGEIRVQGQKVTRLGDSKLADIRNKVFGFVYQHHYLMRDFTALENVMMPALIGGRRGAQKYAKDLLAQVGLKSRMTHRPGQLSGGEQQRVAIARALMNQPKILFADEPTGNLDTVTTQKVEVVLEELIKEHDLAVLMVTHSQDLAAKADKRYKMHKGTLTAQ